MQAPSFKVDRDAAKKADSGEKIVRTGDYIGEITSAKFIEDEHGAKIQINFKQDGTDCEANYVNMNLFDAEGKEKRYGHNLLNALMVCIGLKDLDSQKAIIQEYDFEEKKNLEVEREIYPGLIGPKVGLVFQKVLYTREKDGRDAVRMQLKGFFDAKNRKTASEKIDGTKAETLDRILETLEDSDDRMKTAVQGDTGIQKNEKVEEQTSAEFDDDIPF